MILAFGYYEIIKTPSIVDVPAGQFEALNFRGRIEPEDPDYPYGIRYNDNYFVKGIGLIKERCYFFGEPSTLEKRLVKYGKTF